MKGIILAAGKGSRLYPMTRPTCKPLLPVYDKPMIYYPLAVLMQAGIKDILIIIPPGEEGPFYRLLGNGARWGVNISYEVQEVARGIADALLIGERFISGDSVCLVLGDNIFHSLSIEKLLSRAVRKAHEGGATVFGYYVANPRAFGVVEFDEEGRAISIEEKPRLPKSNYIIPGLYFYDNNVIEIARGLKPSARGELEISDVNLEYLRRDQLHVIKLDRDFVWLDAGTADNLLTAGQAVKQVQDETGRYVACLEEIAYNRGYIDVDDLHRLGHELEQTLYGQYLLCL
ncbi:MAG: glucose-1-phosphate thymidylyltransferase RfbA [Butyricicoccus sp.]|nr:glucose-1-phosphate thymidylyltransferase RfbA [Butyricicoccus pullicaecorum]MCI6719269.1 glucose-1-phosphate thymidylyltransferase RfbA [Clostridiales bacterium]MDY5972847.1 glucose-1-phosphate thymidylyltransferase RfbA [Butyricicoccus sp.]